MSTSPALAPLQQPVPPAQILFGGDFPLLLEPIMKVQTSALESMHLLDTATRAAIDRENNLRLSPRLSGPAAR